MVYTKKDISWLLKAECGARLFSTCAKRFYMAIVVDANGFQVSDGYNGSASGTVHCVNGGCPRALENSQSGSSYNNCFHGDTEFITRQGVRRLSGAVGEVVDVLTSKGWRSGRVESFGHQDMMAVNVRRYSDRRTILATPGHRWFTYDSHRKRHELRTDELVNGHVLAHAYARSGKFSTCLDGQLAGLVFGDGSCMYDQPGSGSHIQMCGAKNASLNHLWGDRQYSVSLNGDRVYRNLPRKWKNLPDLDESFGYLYGWLQGYFAADGTISQSTPLLYSSKKSNLEFVRELCYILGIPTLHIKKSSRLGYGHHHTDLFRVPFPQGALKPDFFLLDHHREKSQMRKRQRDMPRWTVESVELHGSAEAYCAVVPDLHEFTLTDNILTGNCFAIHAESNCLMRSDAHRTVGSTLYVNGSPCHDCAKLIAGSKVARLVCLNDTAYSSWEEKSKPYLLDVGVEVVDIPMEQFYTDHVRPIRGLSLERPQAQHISSET